MRKITINKKKKILALRKAGKTYKDIFLLTGVGGNALMEIIKEAEKK